MATITSLSGGILPSAPSSSRTNYARDTVVLETAVSHSWLSAEGHEVILLGTFTYPGGAGTAPSGTVDQIIFDHDDDGTNDLTVTYDTPKSIVFDHFTIDQSLLNFMFDQADTMTLAGTTDDTDFNGTRGAFFADLSGVGSFTPSSADTLTITGAGLFSADSYSGITDGTVQADDTVTINSTLGDVEMVGDQILLGSFGGGSATSFRTLTFGADEITDSSAASALTHKIVGDLLQTRTGSEFFVLNFGDDTITGGDVALEIVGDLDEIGGSDLTMTGGADSITGSTQGDDIVGDFDLFGYNLSFISDNNLVTGGDDEVDAGGGDDLVIGDVREDDELNTITGGGDTVEAGAGQDTLIGDVGTLGTGSILLAGDDELSGEVGDDLIYGDYQTVEAGGTVATGGNDTLSGGNGNDTLMGQEGNDILLGGGDDDLLLGGAGDDSIDGGSGEDTLDYSAALAGVTLTLNGATSAMASGQGADLVRNVEHLIGSALDDNFTGDGADNVLIGGAGADTLTGGAGIDTADYSASASGVNVSLSTGVGLGGDAAGDSLSQIETLIGSAHDDTLTGNGSDNLLTGGTGQAVLRGLGGSDTLEGDALGDDLSGGVGNDSLLGGDGADTIRGQGDDDTIAGGEGDDVITAGAGADEVAGGAGADDIIGQGQDDTLNGGLGNDTILGGSGNDLINGGFDDDDLSGAGNNDTINGDDGNDILRGAAGLDELFGGAGDDVLNGGDGADRHDGGSGNDTMNGGGTDGVRDTYVFGLGYETDRINAFDQLGTDRIELDDALWLVGSGALTEQQVIDTFGSLNTAGTLLTLDFGGGDILEVQNSGGIDQTTMGLDVLII